MRRPLSLQQQALLDAGGFQRWALSEAATLSVVLRVRGPLDLDLLAEAFALLVSRHEVLRTRLIQTSETPRGYAEVVASVASPLELDDGGLADELLLQRWESMAIDPGRPPLARCFAAPRGTDEHLIGLVFSHAAMDPTSLRVAAEELGDLYSALRNRASLPPPVLQYGAYVASQAERLRSTATENRAALARALAGVRPPRYARAFPFVVGRPAAPVISTSRLFERREIDGLAAWSLRHRSTLSTTLLAAFARAVRAEAHGDDLIVSTIFEQRDHPAARRTLGLFLWGVLIRLLVRERESMQALVARTRPAVLEAYKRAQLPMLDYAAMAPRLVPGLLGLAPAWLRFFQYVPRVHGEVRFGEAVATIAHTSGRMDPRDMIGVHLGVFHADDGSLFGRFSYDSNDLDRERAASLLADFRAYAMELTQ